MAIILMGQKNPQKDVNLYLDQVGRNEDPITVKQAIDSLRKIFLEYTWEYSMDFHFFSYYPERQLFLRLYNLSGENAAEDKKVQSEVVRLIKSEQTDGYSVNRKWDVIPVDQDNYLVKILKSDDCYLGCYIKADNIFNSLDAIDIKKGGIYVLVNRENRIISKIGENEPSLISRILGGHLYLDKELSRIPFRVRMAIRNYGVFEKALIVQVMLILLTIFIFLTQTSMMVYLKKTILFPIQKFTKNLNELNDEDSPLNISWNELKELEDANKQFRNILKQMKRLKIDLYEKELEKQKLKTDFLQIQINPHFYLNCMDLVYQMIELDLPEDAKKMLKMVSEYLRSLFQKGMELIPINDELAHVRKYLDIYKMRYHKAFEYEIAQDENAMDDLIPPLIIQTFVENSIKHIVTLDDQIEIYIKVQKIYDKGEPFIFIKIADTGTGFPSDILKKLSRGESLQNHKGEKVGITNCLSRIEQLYSEKRTIHFYNHREGGAVVEFRLPVLEKVTNP